MVLATQLSDSESEELLSRSISDVEHEILSARFSTALTDHFAKQTVNSKVDDTVVHLPHGSAAAASATTAGATEAAALPCQRRAGAIKRSGTSLNGLNHGGAVVKKMKSQHNRQREGIHRTSTSKYRGVTRHRCQSARQIDGCRYIDRFQSHPQRAYARVLSLAT